MVQIYSVVGCCSFTLDNFILFEFFCQCVELLFVVFRFRMRKPLFLRIMRVVEEHDHYFVQKRDAAGKKGRMLTYGVSADATYEYIRIGESTALESLHKFVTAIV